MRSKGIRVWSSFLLILVLSLPAYADGGLSALGGLLDMLLLFVGVIGLPVVALMISIVSSGRNNGHSNTKTTVILVISWLYVVCALLLYVVAQTREFAKFPALVAVSVVALHLIFSIRDRKWLLNAVLAPMGIATVAMLATPAEIWEDNVFDLVESIFVDNTDGLEIHAATRTPDSSCNLLILKDGREFLQFTCSDSKPPQRVFPLDPDPWVTLREFDTEKAGQWFEVTHYEQSYAYRRARERFYSPPRYSLFQTEVDKYVTVGNQSIVVVLNEDAEIDHRAWILDALEQADDGLLEKALLRIGNLDVNEQSFIDAAFKTRTASAYRGLNNLGVDPHATDHGGSSILHRAAEAGDVQFMQFLVRRGASLTAVDGRGLTPLQLYREKYAERRAKMRELDRAFPQSVSH